MSQTLDPDWLARLREQLIAIEPDMATDEELLFHTVDGQTDIIDQLRAILRHAIEADIFADALGSHMKVLSKRKQRFEGRADACRITVRDALEVLGIKRVLAEDFTATLSAGHTAVVVTDPDKLPAYLFRISRSPNLTAIGDALKAGTEVPGATLNNAAPILTVRRI
jgi:hypothetical protein